MTLLKTGILNPHIASLLARFRHTNTIVIADRGFPFWPQIETIDLSLVDNIPTVEDVLRAILPHVSVGPIFMAEEFRTHNPASVLQQRLALTGNNITWEPHPAFKLRVPQSLGLIRTGDTIPYDNIILESA
jgi:D-ribose pyranase